jgi:two-component system sensor histidine kinase AlgZ
MIDSKRKIHAPSVRRRNREPYASPSDIDSGAQSVVPNFCGITQVFAVVLGGQLLAFVLVFAAGWAPGQLWERISLVSLYVQWIALSSAGLLCLARPWLRRWGDLPAGLTAWLIIMLVTAAAAELALVLGDLSTGLLDLNHRNRWDLLLRSLGVSGIAAALMLRYLYLYSQWQRQVVARSEARFQALQARIRPHFLFNSMNTVASLTRSDPRRAEALVEDLADLFRAALSDPEGGSTLGRELELARQYLSVEQQRLGGRLRLEWDLEELPEEASLPLLVLQPLVENAVYHGIELSSEIGVIRIAGRYRDRRVNLSVRNSLPLSSSGEGHREGNRMALDSVRQRLAAMYPERCSLTVGRVEDEFQVRMAFPYP